MPRRHNLGGLAELSLRCAGDWARDIDSCVLSPLSLCRHTDNQRAEVKHHWTIENNVKSTVLWDEKTEHFMIDHNQLWMNESSAHVFRSMETLLKIEDGRCDV